MILIKLIDIIKMNNLFSVSSIIVNYSFKIILKSCTILNHNILGHLGPLDGNLNSIDLSLRSLVYNLFQKYPTALKSIKLVLLIFCVFLAMWLRAASCVLIYLLTWSKLWANTKPGPFGLCHWHQKPGFLKLYRRMEILFCCSN